ncbi:MAG: hypothetical protein CL897_05040 [Dehalococcoidia bacterium]|nr:hypothetical protein [Dehalococcoidia bacterium]HCU99624.1 hypothetical protein [Dehalococcoidia bacterium]
MSEDFGIDLDEVRRVIEESEVLIIRLETVGSRVLVDFRSTPTEPPFISRVPRVNSVEERIRAVKELRPTFPYPEKLMSFAWPRRVTIIAESGLWEAVRGRMESIGGEASGDDAARIHRELLDEERREVVAAVRGGEGMRTIWQQE